MNVSNYQQGSFDNLVIEQKKKAEHQKQSTILN